MNLPSLLLWRGELPIADAELCLTGKPLVEWKILDLPISHWKQDMKRSTEPVPCLAMAAGALDSTHPPGVMHHPCVMPPANK